MKQQNTELGRELAQYVQGLYYSGAKLWTKETFVDIEAELTKEWILTKDPLPKSIMMRCMNGDTYQNVNVPNQEMMNRDSNGVPQMILLGFQHYQSMTESAKRYNDYVRGVPVTSLTDEIKRQYTNALRVVWTAVPTSKTEYSTLKTRWDQSQQEWLQSPGCRELIAMLKRVSLPKIKNIVCFGLGSLDRKNNDGSPSSRTHTQHAAALTMASVLGKRYGKDTLPVLLQDPYYNPIEKQLLTDLGFEVVGGHGALGFTLVDDASLVFTVAPDVPVRQIIADIATPAVMIWNTVKPAEIDLRERGHFEEGIKDGKKWTTDNDSPRTRKLVEGYNELEFPGDDEDLDDLKI